jgi:transmembrane protein EpsG
MGYISLPWLIDNMFTKNSARVVKLIMIVAYFVYFYYQMFIIWA